MHHFIYILNRIFGSEKMSTIDELSINTDNDGMVQIGCSKYD